MAARGAVAIRFLGDGKKHHNHAIFSEWQCDIPARINARLFHLLRTYRGLS